jgi:Cu(I)-responsive transcriptional regulator
MPERLTIGRLAKATGTKVETIRWYEKVGLIDPPQRTDANYRVYAQRDLARLSFIRRARNLGFSLDQIRALIDIADQQDRDCATVDAIASAHLEEIDRKIADLTALRRELGAVVASCRGGSVANCRILEALEP